MKYLRLPEACYRLHISDKTMRRWIKQGSIEYKQEQGVYLIPESAITAILARREARGGEPWAGRIEALETKINALSEGFTALSERVTMLERTRPVEQAGTSPVEQERPKWMEPSRRTYRTQVPVGALPSGLVPEYRFYHGVSPNTAKRWMEAAGVPVVRGHWVTGGHHYDRALDAEGRRKAYEALKDHPNFQPCEQCPHEDQAL